LIPDRQPRISGESAARQKFLVLRVEDVLLLEVNADDDAVADAAAAAAGEPDPLRSAA
jgi:hypothetical protein